MHWVKNDNVDNYHAEEYFLEQIFEPRSYSFCDITWYLSWSPCEDCCAIIQDFLEEEHNVNMHIHVARLYYEHDPGNCAALRELASFPRVTIQAMDVEDYMYCWDTFLQTDGYFDFTAGSFLSVIEKNRLKLEEILMDLHL
ncbi:PREDICTED: C-_U-editing enzyme APOBEC-1-like [Sturnus vulgaris]|uniref:C->U-editing enzyme APOBEC-1-like n=1 Tax=Sturnus vulgaris TaxID=9172 RepID=UPI00071A37DC|nr:PREDICTED: C->U-editing enzyme APOBEC-1-like [Sturnus vulgaris]